MDWGLLQGLGQGLQQLGGMKMEQDAEKRRAQMAEKLQADREERQEQRMRTRPDPSQTTYEEGEGGVTWKIIRSATGNELERVLAPKTDIEKIKRDTAKEKLSMDALTAQIDASKATTEGKKLEMEWGKEDRSLLTPEQRKAQALIDAKLAPSADTKYSTDGSLQRAIISKANSDNAEASATPTEYAKAFVDDSPEVKAQWVDSGKMTETQLTAAVKAAFIRFAQVGKTPSVDDINGYIAGALADSPDKFGKPKPASSSAEPVTTKMNP